MVEITAELNWGVGERRPEDSHILYTASSSWFRNSCGGTAASRALSTCVTGNTEAA